MWRSAGVTYLRYSNEMASVLRQCLKEPYRSKALARETTHVVEKTWANGNVQSRVVYDNLRSGFEASSGAGDAKK
eukprot:NODE_31440_length_396_cov_5.661710.p3 GENE.NODE_31440_length_396_cov_5.661710~~NODE_31440_length_396_cov_5.661710.p3  ORF type:complete len:75 (-),score=17.70 NODE_31440_length_396_cov_5.661710:94-318(-)